MFKTLAATMAASASATLMSSSEFDFMKWIAKYNRSYATIEEYNFRLARFLAADAYIKMVNAPNSGYSHTAGHNKFSDYTEAEFERMLNRQVSSSNADTKVKARHEVKAKASAARDWRTSGCVTPVKDQG